MSRTVLSAIVTCVWIGGAAGVAAQNVSSRRNVSERTGGPIAPLTARRIERFEVGPLRVDHFGRRGKRAVVLIPALFCGVWQWNREIDSLAPRYDIYALTLPGFDGRPLADTSALMRRTTRAIDELIRRRHLAKPIIVGHSLGGTIAVMFGEVYPHDPGAVIAVEGGYPIASTAAKRAQRVRATVAPFLGARASTLRQILETHILRYTITRPADVDTVAVYAARSSPLAIVAWMRAALSLDLTNGLRRMQAPLLEIVPFDSTIDPYQGFATARAKRAAYRAWLANAPDGSVALIPHSRHFVMFDRPTLFDRVLFAAVRKYGAAG